MALAAERLAAKDPDAALTHLNAALAKNEKSIGLQLFKIGVLASIKDQERVEAVFEKLRELYPKKLGIAVAFAHFYIGQDRKDDAEKVLRAAVAANPDNIQFQLALVRFLHEFKGDDAAKQALKDRIAKGSETFPFQLALAKLHAAQGQAAEAENILKEITAEDETTTDALTARIELAKLMITSNRRDEARALVDAVLAKDKSNVDGLLIRASMLASDKKYGDAISELRLALNEEPRSPRILSFLGRVHELNGDIQLAEEQFAIAAKVSNYHPRAGLQYSQFLQRHGRLDRAETILSEVAQRHSRNKKVLRALANVRLRNQDWLGAQQVAEVIRKLGDEDVLANRVVAAALAGQNKLDESIRQLEASFVEGKHPEQLMATLFSSYLRAGKEMDARALVENAIVANPKNSQALVLRGTLHLRQKKLEEAKQDFQRAIETQPNAVAGYRALANWHLRAGDTDEAIRVLRNALETQGDSIILRMILASILERQGKFNESIAEYELMVQARPLAPVLANNLASLLADHRSDEASLDKAYELAKRLQTSPQPSFKDTLGWVYYRKGQYDSAILLLKEATDGLPNRPLVRYHLGMAYKAVGENELARDELSKALELSENALFHHRDAAERALQELQS